jgi:hypothetical protein
MTKHKIDQKRFSKIVWKTAMYYGFDTVNSMKQALSKASYNARWTFSETNSLRTCDLLQELNKDLHELKKITVWKLMMRETKKRKKLKQIYENSKQQNNL